MLIATEIQLQLTQKTNNLSTENKLTHMVINNATCIYYRHLKTCALDPQIMQLLGHA